MARTLEELVIKLSADNTDLKRKLSQSGAEVRGFASNAERSFSSMTASVRTLGAAIAGAFVVREFAQFAKAALELGGSLNDTAQRLGVTAEALQVYRAQAQEAGVDSAAVDSSLQSFAKTFGQLQAGIGRATKQLAALDPALLANLRSAQSTEEAYKLVADAVRAAAEAGDQQRAAAIASATGMSSLLGVLKEGADAFDEFGSRARESGLILSNEAASALDSFGEALDRVKQASLVGFAEGLAGADSQARSLTATLSDPETLKAISDYAGLFGRAANALAQFAAESLKASRTRMGQAMWPLPSFLPPSDANTGGASGGWAGYGVSGSWEGPPGTNSVGPPILPRARRSGGGGGGGRSRSSGNAAPIIDSSIRNFDYFAAEKASFKALTEDYDKGLTKMRKSSEEFADEGIEHWRKMQDAAETFGSFAGNVFGSLVRDGKLDFKSLGLSFAQTIVEMEASALASFLFKQAGAADGGKGLLGTIISGLGSILGLADGGIVTRPTLAMIGEGGEPEAVIPLSKMRGNRAPVVNIINSGAPIDVTGSRTNERGELDVMVEASIQRTRARGGLRSPADRHAPGIG